MPGLDPGIHDLLSSAVVSQNVYGRDKPGHDEKILASHPLRFFAFTAIAAAAVRFSTPSLE